MTKQQRNETLAKEIYDFLIAKDMWQDVRIYFNNKAFSTDNGNSGNRQFRYNGEPFVLENINPQDFFEYAVTPEKHILSMSFEGPLYEALNYGNYGNDFYESFQKLFKKHGLYFELGHAWNLTCYEG